MIRNDVEHRLSLQRLADMEVRLKEQRVQLKAMSLSNDEIKRVLDPVRIFQQQIQAEVDSYERLQRGEFDEIVNFSGLGQLLIAIRIASGVTQRVLAERMQVNESQISRDERNEYHNITIDRANRILEALGAQVRTSVIPQKTPTARVSRTRATAGLSGEKRLAPKRPPRKVKLAQK